MRVETNQSIPIGGHPGRHGFTAGRRGVVLGFQHPLDNLSATDREIGSISAGKMIEIQKHLITFVSAQVSSILTNELRIIVLSDCPFVLIIEVAFVHLGHGADSVNGVLG